MIEHTIHVPFLIVSVVIKLEFMKKDTWKKEMNIVMEEIKVIIFLPFFPNW